MPRPSPDQKFSASELILGTLLAWLIPGAGHFFIGLRKRAVLLFICIEVTFLIGLYIGTIRIVNPGQSSFWFLAQIFAGLNTIVGHFGSLRLEAASAGPLIRDWSYHLGVLYTGLAGLLNLLAVFDTVIRAGRANIGQEPLPAD